MRLKTNTEQDENNRNNNSLFDVLDNTSIFFYPLGDGGEPYELKDDCDLKEYEGIKL